MIKSMTGYGRAESRINGRKYLVEIKSVNHRYLDVSVRMPSFMGLWEQIIRKRLGEAFSRGKIDLTIRIDPEGGDEGVSKLSLNLPLIQNYYELLIKIKEELNLKEEITLPMIAGMRDIFVPPDPLSDQEEKIEHINIILNEAIAATSLMREREGEMLCQAMLKSADLIKGCLEEIRVRAPQVIHEYRQRLSERIKDLVGGMPVDEGRLAQEVAIMAEKSDITEEITRIESHLGQFYDLMQMNEAAGRKVDFLLQELNREVNTISAKSNDLKIAHLVINMKTELAKLREQGQNIE